MTLSSLTPSYLSSLIICFEPLRLEEAGKFLQNKVKTKKKDKKKGLIYASA